MPPQQEKPSDGGRVRVSMRRGGVPAAEEEDGESDRSDPWGSQAVSTTRQRDTKWPALVTSPHFSPVIGSEKSKSIYKFNRAFYLHKLCYFRI
jgi:hypothetical protein